jgi:hypothetical protein
MSTGVRRKKSGHFYSIVEYFILEFETLKTVSEIQKTLGNRSYFGFQSSRLVLLNGTKTALTFLSEYSVPGWKSQGICYAI